MQTRKAFHSLLQLFAGFSFFGAALFFLSLPILPNVRLKISNTLLQSPEICISIGTGLMIASFLLIGGFYLLSRGKHLILQMGNRKTAIATDVIHKTIEECLKEHFEGEIFLSDVSVIRGGKLAIEVILTPFEENVREELFASLQNQVAPLLSERFGYKKSFCLIAKNH